MRTCILLLAVLVSACRADLGNWHTKVTAQNGKVYYVTGGGFNILKDGFALWGPDDRRIKLGKGKVTLEYLD